MKFQQEYLVSWLLNPTSVYDSVTITEQWILTTGFWNDSGFWQDDKVWID